jgi:hypothetical protein
VVKDAAVGIQNKRLRINVTISSQLIIGDGFVDAARYTKSLK